MSDEERAREIVEAWQDEDGALGFGLYVDEAESITEALAAALSAVRRETIERCAAKLHRIADGTKRLTTKRQWRDAAETIRALATDDEWIIEAKGEA